MFGMFKSKKKTHVGTSVVRAIEDRAVPNALKKGVLGSVVRNGDVTEFILGEMKNSITTTAPRMFRYAKRGNYIYGLPRGTLYTDEVGKDAVIEIIKEETGDPSIEVDYVRLGPMILDHLTWQYLQDDLEYDPVSNEIKKLSRERGTTVYLVDSTLQLSSAQIAEYSESVLAPLGNNLGSTFYDYRWYRANKAIEEFKEGVEDRIKIDFFWYSDPSNKRSRKLGTYYYALPEDHEEGATFYQASYRQGDLRYFWTYKVGQGTYPILDDEQGLSTRVFGEFYPFTYLRYGKTKPSKSSEWYKSSEKLMNKIGLDYAGAVEGVHDNPDIKDVEQAIIFFAVSPNSKDPVDLEYLFEFFSFLKADTGTAPTSTTSYNAWTFLAKKGNRKYVTSFKDKRFTKSLRYDGIFESIKMGTLGPINSFHQSRGSVTRIVYYRKDYDTGEETPIYGSAPYHTFRKQLTQHLYREIKVFNLEMVYHVWGSHHTVGEEGGSTLLVPIDNEILKRVRQINRERLLSRSAHFVFNSRVVQKVKWYERGFFKALVQIVTIVLTIFAVASGQFHLATALIAAGMYTALAMVILEMILIAAITTIATRWVVKAVGPELGAIIAIVAAVVTFSKGFLGDRFANMPWADSILKASSGLISEVNKYYSDALKGIQGDFAQLQKEIEEATKLLEDTQKLLESNNVLSPLYVIGETPEAYYNRTKYVGQAGLDVIGLTKSFHKRALLLPEVSDTMGDDTNEWITV